MEAIVNIILERLLVKGEETILHQTSLNELDLNSDKIDFSNLRGNIFNFTAKD